MYRDTFGTPHATNSLEIEEALDEIGNNADGVFAYIDEETDTSCKLGTGFYADITEPETGETVISTIPSTHVDTEEMLRKAGIKFEYLS